jgi:hypothetical protein
LHTSSDKQVIQLLLELNMKATVNQYINAKNYSGRIPINNHRINNNVEIIKLLLKYGARVDTSCYSMLCSTSDIAIIKLLIENGANIYGKKIVEHEKQPINDNPFDNLLVYTPPSYRTLDMQYSGDVIEYYLNIIEKDIGVSNMTKYINYEIDYDQTTKQIIDIDINKRLSVWDHKKDPKATKLLLKYNAIIRMADAGDMMLNMDFPNPLYLNNDVESVRILLENGVDCNQSADNNDFNNFTALHYHMLKTLHYVEKKGKYAGNDYNDRDPNNLYDLMKLYFDHGFDIKNEPLNEQDLLNADVAEEEMEEYIKEFITREPIFVMGIDDVRVVELLLEKGFDFKKGQSVHRFSDVTLLHTSDNPAIVQLLLKYLDPNVKDYNNKTPLNYTKPPQVIKLLLDAGGKHDHKDNFGKTPIFYQIELESVKLLLEKDPKQLMHRDNNGNTLLHSH